MAEKQTDEMHTQMSTKSAKGNRLITALAIICGLLLVAEFFYKKKPGLAIEATPLLYVIVAIVTVVFSVALSRIMKKLLSRNTDYYAPRDVDDEDYPQEQLEREASHD